MPANLLLCESTSHQDIITFISENAPKGAHFTNGTFDHFPKDFIIPTLLTGFKRVTRIKPSIPLVVAINSDESMRALGKETFEPQTERADKIKEALSKCFPNNPILIVFYDEPTPTALYQKLGNYHKNRARQNQLTYSLHKWGFGTKENQPGIEGAEFFELVYGFPLPDDTKPICYDETKVKSDTIKVIVCDLVDEGYITSGREPLFETINDINLKKETSPLKKTNNNLCTIM